MEVGDSLVAFKPMFRWIRVTSGVCVSWVQLPRLLCTASKSLPARCPKGKLAVGSLLHLKEGKEFKKKQNNFFLPNDKEDQGLSLL